MKQTNINIDEIKRFPTVTNPIKADDLHTPQAYAYTLRNAIVIGYTDEQRANYGRSLYTEEQRREYGRKVNQLTPDEERRYEEFAKALRERAARKTQTPTAKGWN